MLTKKLDVGGLHMKVLFVRFLIIRSIKYVNQMNSFSAYEAFPTKNGYLTVGAGSDSQFRALCNCLQIPEYADNAKFKTNRDRVKHRQELISKLSAIFAKETNDHWMKLFENEPFPAGPINNMKEVFSDPHIQSIQLVKTLKHPTAGVIKVVGPPVTYSVGKNEAISAPPLLGQHTDDVLSNLLHYDESQIQKLRAEKIIQ